MERQYEGRHQTLQPADPTGSADTQLDEVDYRPLDPRVRLLWWLIAGLAVGAGLSVAAVAAVPLEGGERWLPLLAVAVVGGPLAAFLPALRYRRWRFALRSDDLWIRHGVLWQSTSVIPYARLQFVDTTQGPLDRAFGLAQLVVHTAAPGTSGRLPGLAVEEAEVLREKLARVRATARDV